MPVWTREPNAPRARSWPPPHRSRGALAFEVGLPEIEIDRVALGGACAPELASLEANVVEVLRLIAESVRSRVGEYEPTVMPLHHAALAARVARQAGMARRVHVPGDHGLADFEAGRGCDLGARREPRLNRGPNLRLRQRGHQPLRPGPPSRKRSLAGA